jgi:hypothetical protein
MVSSKSASLTFEEYLVFEDGTDNRYELIHGELVMVPLPTGLHSDIIEFLQDTFKEVQDDVRHILKQHFPLSADICLAEPVLRQTRHAQQQKILALYGHRACNAAERMG